MTSLRRRWFPLALFVVVLGIVGGACGLTSPSEELDRRNDGPGSSYGYVIEPVPAGYERCAVSGPSGLEVSADDSPSVQVYGDAGLDDPYAGALFGVAVFRLGAPDAVPTLDDVVPSAGDGTDVEVLGHPARLGRIDGFVLATLPADAGQALTWVLDDGRIVQLVARGHGGDVDLVAIAAGVDIGDDGATIAASVLPVDAVDLGDLYQLEGQARFRFSVDHQRLDSQGEVIDPLTLLGSAGDNASMEAFRFRVPTSRRVDVAGRPGVVAELGSGDTGPWTVSWLPEDGLILRLFSFQVRPDELVEIAGDVQRLEGDAWRDLVDESGVGSCIP